jgi:hypothetical protein
VRIVSFVLLMGLALPAAAVETEIGELVARPQDFAGLDVTVTGELVGDYSPRQEGVWVQVNDDAFVGSPIGAGGQAASTNVGVGALVPTPVFEQVAAGEPGRHGRTGPIVTLTGVFVYQDPALGGETYLRVEEATLVAAAGDHPAPGPDVWLVVGSGLLAFAGLGTALIRRRPPGH